MAKLRDYAKIIRSKNAGPYEITFDILFPDRESYEIVKASGILCRETVCALYHVTPDKIKAMLWFEPAQAFKFTIVRPGRSLQGSVGENDTYGTQQHAPLLDLEIIQGAAMKNSPAQSMQADS